MKVYWLDANVVVRFLTGDPEDMAAEAQELMRRAERGQVSLFLPVLVAAEIVWVLRSFYRHSASSIEEVLTAFLTAPGIETEEREILVEALHLATLHNVDFLDAYLALRARDAGASVCTFDSTDFERLPGAWSRPRDVSPASDETDETGT